MYFPSLHIVYLRGSLLWRFNPNRLIPSSYADTSTDFYIPFIILTRNSVIWSYHSWKWASKWKKLSHIFTIHWRNSEKKPLSPCGTEDCEYLQKNAGTVTTVNCWGGGGDFIIIIIIILFYLPPFLILFYLVTYLSVNTTLPLGYFTVYMRQKEDKVVGTLFLFSCITPPSSPPDDAVLQKRLALA